MTPTDKELIRLAAKAFFDGEDEATHAIVSLGWNPKDNNEDAFMLAAWLEIRTETNRQEIAAAWGPVLLGGTRYVFQVDESLDIYAALRLAILYAAAEMGRRMP